MSFVIVRTSLDEFAHHELLLLSSYVASLDACVTSWFKEVYTSMFNLHFYFSHHDDDGRGKWISLIGFVP